MPIQIERTDDALTLRRPRWPELAREWPWLLLLCAWPVAGLLLARGLRLGAGGTFLAALFPAAALLGLRVPPLVRRLGPGALVLRRVGGLIRAGAGPALPPRAYEVMLSGRQRLLGPWVHQVTLRMTDATADRPRSIELLAERFGDGEEAGALAAELGAFLQE